MHKFRERLATAIDQSGKWNARTLSLQSGLGEKTISNLLANDSVDRSNTGPGIFSMSRVCDNLNISLDWLAGRQETMAPLAGADKELALLMQRIANAGAAIDGPNETPPLPTRVQRLYAKSGGKLAAFNDLLRFCDRYKPMSHETREIEVIAVGEESLSAITMGAPDAKVLQMALNSVPENQLRAKLINDHIEAQERGCLSTVEALDIQMPNKPVRVRMDYIRTIVHVEDDDGSWQNLLYASLII